MVEIKFDKPPVHMTRSGVSYVEAADILKSAIGQLEIEKAARVMDEIREKATSAPEAPTKG
jgi:hypothetical protein